MFTGNSYEKTAATADKITTPVKSQRAYVFDTHK